MITKSDDTGPRTATFTSAEGQRLTASRLIITRDGDRRVRVGIQDGREGPVLGDVVLVGEWANDAGDTIKNAVAGDRMDHHLEPWEPGPPPDEAWLADVRVALRSPMALSRGHKGTLRAMRRLVDCIDGCHAREAALRAQVTATRQAIGEWSAAAAKIGCDAPGALVDRVAEVVAYKTATAVALATSPEAITMLLYERNLRVGLSGDRAEAVALATVWWTSRFKDRMRRPTFAEGLCERLRGPFLAATPAARVCVTFHPHAKGGARVVDDRLVQAMLDAGIAPERVQTAMTPGCVVYDGEKVWGDGAVFYRGAIDV